MEHGEQLRQLRRQRQLTQEDVAEALGVSRQSVSAWEKGISQPTVANLSALARLYDLPLDALAGGAPVQARGSEPAAGHDAAQAEPPLPRIPRWGRVSVPILALLLTLCANSWLVLQAWPGLIPLAVVAFLAANLLPGWFEPLVPDTRLRVVLHGAEELEVFCLATGCSVLIQAALAAFLLPGQWELWVWSVGVCAGLLLLCLWNGVICLFLTSVQFGLRLRLLGWLLGWVPVFHLWLLGRMIRTARAEVRAETEKDLRNKARHDRLICRTKYPVLLVHGFAFRDSPVVNYWGRIPRELERNGAMVYYGEHQSAASVEHSAQELKARIRNILADSGCEKLNVIAHSKGGLDMRLVLADPEFVPLIASLTTINTPHRGCAFADALLEKVKPRTQSRIERFYNFTARHLGDKSPDFMGAVHDLTAARCLEFDKAHPAPEGVLCRSIGSRLNHWRKAGFPQNLTYLLARHYDGPNDGLVCESSFRWGSTYRYLTRTGPRGISHVDMVDLYRRNLEDFDVREFYVNLLSELRQLGY